MIDRYNKYIYIIFKYIYIHDVELHMLSHKSRVERLVSSFCCQFSGIRIVLVSSQLFLALPSKSVFFIFFFGILIFKQIASHLTATSLRDAPPLSVDLMLKVLPLSVTMAAVGLLECLGRRRRMKIYEGEIRCEILSIRRLLTSCYLSLVYLRCI